MMAEENDINVETEQKENVVSETVEEKQTTPIETEKEQNASVENKANQDIPVENKENTEEKVLHIARQKEGIADKLKKTQNIGKADERAQANTNSNINTKDNEKEAKLEQEDDEDDQEKKKKGDKFTQGDVIDYIYSKWFLEGVLSNAFDYLDNVLIGIGTWAGKTLGDSAKEFHEGLKNLQKNTEKNKQVREYDLASRCIGNWRSNVLKGNESLRKHADSELDKIQKVSELIATPSYSEFEKMLAEERAKIQASQSAAGLISATTPWYEELSELELSAREKRGKSTAELNRLFIEKKEQLYSQKKLQKRFGKFLASALRQGKEGRGAYLNRVGSIIKSFKYKNNLICDYHKRMYNLAALQTMAEYGKQLGKKVAPKEKTKLLTSLYHKNLKDIQEQVGDIYHRELSFDDKKQLDNFFNNREKAAEKANAIITGQLKENYELAPDGQKLLDKQLEDIQNIQGPHFEKETENEPSEGKNTNSDLIKEATPEEFCEWFYKPNPEQEKLEKESAEADKYLAKKEAQRENIKARKEKTEKMKLQMKKHLETREQRRVNDAVNSAYGRVIGRR